jgi:hypothetical protein
MNLTPDTMRASYEWKVAKRAYSEAAAALRAFNATYVRQFKKEIQGRAAGRKVYQS